MAEQLTQPVQKQGQRKQVIGYVTSNKMAKTIVVEVTRQKAHALYRRVVKRSSKFYAHDEKNTARVGDVVRIEETRPMSRLKRWRLLEIVRRAALHEDTKGAVSPEQQAS